MAAAQARSQVSSSGEREWGNAGGDVGGEPPGTDEVTGIRRRKDAGQQKEQMFTTLLHLHTRCANMGRTVFICVYSYAETKFRFSYIFKAQKKIMLRYRHPEQAWNKRAWLFPS